MKEVEVCGTQRHGERHSEMTDNTPPPALAILTGPFTGWTRIVASRYTGKWSLLAAADTQDYPGCGGTYTHNLSGSHYNSAHFSREGLSQPSYAIFDFSRVHRSVTEN